MVKWRHGVRNLQLPYYTIKTNNTVYASTGKLTVAANNGVAQIKPTNSGLYTTVYDKTGQVKRRSLLKTFAVSKTATLGI